MNHLKQTAAIIILLLAFQANAQEKKKTFSVTGSMGLTYETYGLNRIPGPPSSPSFYSARKPWNLVRYSFNPTFMVGKWEIPMNFNFSPLLNNFTTPSGTKQNLWQFLTNPANNFGLNPKIGKTELLLGTQNLKYSDLSTGDIGVFGYGLNLAPGKFRIKLFKGVSQSPVNYEAPSIPNPNGVIGAYQRNQWMAQLGLEKEGVYFTGFNFVKSIDKRNSVSAPPLSPIDPQENMAISFFTTATSEKGWRYHIELGQSFHTLNLNTPLSITPVADFKPFINSHTSTNKDNAVIAGIAKKGADWEIGTKFKYFGAGYFTAGFPFMKNDLIDYLIDTRFNLWKKKMNVVGSFGERFGNLSRTAGPDRTLQLIANINIFTQFTDRFSLNTSFNNFGYSAPDLSGYKSVSNELSLNPSYTWSNTKMSNMLSATYTKSIYDETIVFVTTHNNTQTAMLLYVPTFFDKKLNPDFSLMWFKNTAPLIDLTLFTATTGLTWDVSKKFKFKGQLQYNTSTMLPFTANKNLMATASYDWKLQKKLSWQFSMTANVFHFGSEIPGNTLTPIYSGNPQYYETTMKTGLLYKF